MSRLPQYKLNAYAALVLSRFGLPCRSEAHVDGKTPDFICTHPVAGLVIGEAEVGETPLDKNARSKLKARIRDRFKDPVFKGFDTGLMIVYPRRALEELAGKSEETIIEELQELEVGVGVGIRLNSQDKYEWADVPIKLRNAPLVFNELLESMLKSAGVLGKSYKELIKSMVDIVERYAESIATEKIRDGGFKARLRDVALALGVAWDDIVSERDKVLLTTKLLLIILSLMMILYEVARSERSGRLQPLNCNTLSVHKLVSLFESLVLGSAGVVYKELNEGLADILRSVPSDQLLDRAVRSLCNEITANLYVLREAGWYALSELYQRLLSETYRKAFATFYTKLQAARLLAALAVDRFDITVLDPACGTGSLLLATMERRRLQTTRDDIRRLLEESVSSQKPLLDVMNEKLLSTTYGVDALRPACYITSLNLRIAARAGGPDELNIVYAPVGDSQAGSLDILTGRYDKRLDKVAKKRFDLVIMNPPFTRSDRISNLIGETARRELASRKYRFANARVSDVIRAGLAKPFLILADRLLADGGRLAAVLPNSVLSRDSWLDVRKGLLENYTLEYIVISWARGTPNFSSDTQFREILLVARKGRFDTPLRIINLYKRVDELQIDDIERIAMEARAARDSRVVIGKDRSKIATIAVVERSVLERIAQFGNVNLYRLIAFSDPKLIEFHLKLVSKCSVELGSLFEIGSVIDHMRGLSRVEPGYQNSLLHVMPAIWGSGTEAVQEPIVSKPRVFIGVVREDEVKCRYWRSERSFYKARLFILRRGQLDTQSVLMVATRFEAISNVWWPLRPKPKVDWKTVLNYLIYFNSVFGLMHMLGERLETRGLYSEFKKSELEVMPVPDLRGLEPPVNEEHLEKPLPRFIDYLSIMARRFEDWRSAAVEMAETNTAHSSRALLDLAAAKLLKDACGLEPPRDLYKRLHEQVDTLRSIMERGGLKRGCRETSRRR